MGMMELQAAQSLLEIFPALPMIRLNWRMADFRSPVLRGLMNAFLSLPTFKDRVGCEYTEYFMTACIFEGAWNPTSRKCAGEGTDSGSEKVRRWDSNESSRACGPICEL